MTVGERGEHALIEWLRRHLPAPGPDVIVGIGDDAAVLRVRADDGALTTDQQVIVVVK